MISSPGFYANVKYVAISVFYDWYKPEHLDHYLSLANIPDSVGILIFGNAPSFKEDLPELIIQRGTLTGIREFVAGWLKDDLWGFEAELERVAAKHGARFVSKLDAFCHRDDQTCELFYGDDGKLLTYDKHHLSLEAANELGLELSRKYGSISSLFVPAGNGELLSRQAAFAE